MQPIIINVDGTPHQFFQNPNGALFRAAPVEQYAIRRVFNLAVGTAKTVNFLDLQGHWEIISLFISSPADSEVAVEMLDQNNIVFFNDLHKRNTVPKDIPTVLIDSTITMRLTAERSPINLLLLYLKPAYLAYAQDF